MAPLRGVCRRRRGCCAAGVPGREALPSAAPSAAGLVVQPYRLIQQEFSLYSGKARAYMRYKGLDFEQQPATLNAYRRTILPRTGVAMIPVLLTPQGEALQDTTVIIETLEQRHPERGITPPGPRQRLASLLLELYGDEWLLLPAMHYRWNFPAQNQKFIYGEFGRVAWPKGPAWLRRLIGRQLGARFSGFVPRLGITAETMPAIEQWWEETLEALNTHFAQHAYLLGERPCLGDFGFMGPLYAHLGRDPAPLALMRERAPAVMAWVERMNSVAPDIGDWAADDAVPATLDPVFRRLFGEQFPVLRDVAEKLPAWQAAHPGKTLPRSIGRHRFSIGGASAEREMIVYSLWMWQRGLAAYADFDAGERAAVDAWLQRFDAQEAMAFRPPLRISRERNRCVID